MFVKGKVSNRKLLAISKSGKIKPISVQGAALLSHLSKKFKEDYILTSSDSKYYRDLQTRKQKNKRDVKYKQNPKLQRQAQAVRGQAKSLLGVPSRQLQSNQTSKNKSLLGGDTRSGYRKKIG
jgi:hypothetical protein